MKNLRIYWLCVCVVAIQLLMACATQNQTRYRPNSRSASDVDFIGLVLTKQEDGLQTLLYLGSDVATETPIGVEIYDTFRSRGWTQVTHADANNQTEVDVICRLGAMGEKVAAECLSDSRVAPAKSTGVVTVNEITIHRVGGMERARNVLVDLVMRQRAAVVNMAVEQRLR